MFLIITLVLFGVAGALIISGRQAQRNANLLRQAAPTKANEIPHSFPGEMVSVSGIARLDHELRSEHGETECIYFKASTVREYESTRRSGNETKRIRESETISSLERSVPFYVEDRTGRIRVIPEGAEFDAQETLNRFEHAMPQQNSVSFGGLSINLGNQSQTLGHRYIEETIDIDNPVFVLGVVDENGWICRPQPGRDKAGFFISYRDENSLRREWQETAQWKAYGAIGSAIAGVAVLVVFIVSLF